MVQLRRKKCYMNGSDVQKSVQIHESADLQDMGLALSIEVWLGGNTDYFRRCRFTVQTQHQAIPSYLISHHIPSIKGRYHNFTRN